MPKKEIVEYIKQASENHLDWRIIKNKLLETGWKEQEIDDAFYSIYPGQTPPKPAAPSALPGDAWQSQMPQKTSVDPSKGSNELKGGRKLLGESWEIFKKRWKTFIYINILPGLVFLVIIFVILLAILFGMLLKISVPLNPLYIVPPAAILVIGLIIGTVWSQIALIFAVKDRDEQISTREAYKRSRNKIASYFWITILSGLVVGLGFILLVIPGIIFLVWFAFPAFILAAENLKGTSALSKSKEYTKGLFFEVFIRLLFMFAVLQGINLILGIIPIVNFVAPFILGMILPAVQIIFGFLLYENLKAVYGNPISNPTKGSTKIILMLFMLFIIVLVIVFGQYFVENAINSAKNSGQKYIQKQIPADQLELNPGLPILR